LSLGLFCDMSLSCWVAWTLEGDCDNLRKWRGAAAHFAPGKVKMLSRMPRAVGLLGIGWYFAASIVGGVVGGLLLDGWLDSKPAFTLLGLLLGLAVAFWGGYKLLMQVISGQGKEQP